MVCILSYPSLPGRAYHFLDINNKGDEIMTSKRTHVLLLIAVEPKSMTSTEAPPEPIWVCSCDHYLATELREGIENASTRSDITRQLVTSIYNRHMSDTEGDTCIHSKYVLYSGYCVSRLFIYMLTNTPFYLFV